MKQLNKNKQKVNFQLEILSSCTIKHRIKIGESSRADLKIRRKSANYKNPKDLEANSIKSENF